MFRIPNDSPRIVLDLAALGLEAVQVTQDLNNSVPLIAGKPTFVRGYAKIAQNGTGYPSISVRADLHIYQNGREISGSPVASENIPSLTSADDLPGLRTNLQQSFQFHLPAHLLTPGQVTLKLVVNPNLSAPESPDLLGNNSVSATLTVAPSRQPTLVFKAMSSVHQNYDPMAAGSGFWDIINRATTMLPVENFHVFVTPGSVTKPVWTLFEGVKGRSFTLPDDTDWALIWMTVDHLFSSSPDGNPDTHWVGMFPKEDVNGDGTAFNGIGGAVGVKLSDLMDNPPVDLNIPDTAYDFTLVIRMSLGGGTDPWSTLQGGHTLAHELGHNYGRFHIRQRSTCGTSDPARPWHKYFVDDTCTLGKTDLKDRSSPIGYDPISRSLVKPDGAGDLMSYANSDWVSPFTWEALVNAIPAPSAPPPIAKVSGKNHSSFAKPRINPQPLPPHDPIFVWEGVIHPNENSGLLLNGFRLPRGTLDPAQVKSSLNAGLAMPAEAPYHLRLIGNPNEAPLDDRPVTFIGAADGSASTMMFVQAIPDPGAGTRVQLMNGSTVLSEIVASPNVPSLLLGAPGIDATAEALSLAWSATDADGDPLLFSAQFSADGGTSWQSIAVNQPDTGIALSTRHLPGSANCVVRVVASDGFNTAIAVTDPFTIATHAPEVMFQGITDRQRLSFGGNQTINIIGYDAEEGSLDSQLVHWSLSGPSPRTGTGSSVSLADLSPGVYVMGGQATDSDGNSGNASLGFEILPLTVADSEAPAVDGLGFDLGYRSAPLVRVPTQGAQPVARFVHANGMVYSIIEGLPQSAPGASPATLTLAIDPTEMGAASPQTGDVAFSVDENGIPHQYVGNGTVLTPDLLGFGVHAVITRRGGFWNAELAFPDSLIGGWDHSARLALSLQWVNPLDPAGQPGTSLWPASADLSTPSSWGAAFLGTTLPTRENRLPVAVPTGPSVASIDSTTTLGLSGAASYDPDGDALTFSWVQLSGPAVSLQGAEGPSPTFDAAVPDDATAFTFQLTVNDGTSDSAPAVVTVQVVPIASGAAGVATPSVTVDPADGSSNVRVVWPGPAGSAVQIQVSTNLVDWETLTNGVAGVLQTIAVHDASAGQFPERFYRAVPNDQTPVATPGGDLQFNGADGLVTIPSSDSLNALPVTILAWINTTQSVGAYPTMISKYQGGQAHGYALALESGRFDPWYYVDGNNHVEELGGSQLDGQFVADGQWHHLAYVVGLTSAQIYIDGTLMSELAWIGTASATTTSEPLLFGRYNGGSGQPFIGQLDEISIWHRALSEAEVRQHMHHSLQATEPDLLGYWKLDDLDASGVIDATGQGHDGVLSGAVDRASSTAPVYP